ncbi:MAG: phage tail length tape measure family protein [Pseudomonadota bacterium]
MSDFTLSMRLEADPAAFAKGVDKAKTAVVGLTDAAKTVGPAMDAAATAEATAAEAANRFSQAAAGAVSGATALATTQKSAIAVRDTYGIGIQKNAEQLKAEAEASRVSAAAQAAAVQRFRDQLDPTAAASRQASAEIAQLQRWIAEGAVTADEGAAGIAIIEQRLAALGQTAGVSAGQMAMARRTVIMNMADIAQVTAATGGSLNMTAAILPDLIYGLRMMGGSVALVTTALAAMLVTVGGVAYAVHSHAESVKEVDKALRRQGEAVGLTRSELERLARSTADAMGVSVREARAMEAAIAATGAVGEEVFRDLMQVAQGWGQVIGQDATAAAADLADALAKPGEAARKLDDAYNLLTAGQRDHIAALERSGNQEAAQAELLKAIAQRAREAANDIGIFTRAVNWMSDAWDNFGKTVSGDYSLDERIEQLGNLITELEAQGLGGWSEREARGLQQAREEYAKLVAQSRQDEARSAARADDAQRRRSLKDGLDTAGGILPGRSDLQRLEGERARLETAIAALTSGGRLRSDDQRRQYDELTRALDGVINAQRTYASEGERALATARAQAAAVNMDAGAREVWLAREQARIELMGQSVDAEERRRRIEAAGLTAQVQLLSARRQALDSLRAETAANDNLAAAVAGGTAAILAAEKANWLADMAAKGLTDTNGKLAASYDQLARSRAALAAAQGIADLRAENDAARKLQDAIAGGDRSRVRQVTIDNEVDTFARKNKLDAADPQVAAYRVEASRRYATSLADEARQTDMAYNAAARYGDELAKLDELRATGLVSDEAYARRYQELERDKLAASREWQDGVALTLADYVDENTNAALMASRAMKSGLQASEDAFVKWAMTGKMSARDLFNTIAEEALRAAYRMAAVQMFGGGSGGLGIFGSFISAGAGAIFGGGTEAGTVSGGDAFVPSNTGNFARAHTGGIVGRTSLERVQADPVVFSGARRFHGGGMPGLAQDEEPVIVQKGEGIFTPRQMQNADRLIGAALARPQVQFNLNVVNNSSGTQTKTERRQRPDGSFDVDVIVEDVENRMAGRAARGEGPFVQVLEGSYGLQRRGSY